VGVITRQDDITPTLQTPTGTPVERGLLPMSVEPGTRAPEEDASAAKSLVPSTRRGYDPNADVPTTVTRSPELVGIIAVLVLLVGIAMIVWVLRSARSMAQTSLTDEGGGRRARRRGGAISAWEESGRRAEMPRDEDTPRERGTDGMFDDNDDEDNPDRPMSGDSPRGER